MAKPASPGNSNSRTRTISPPFLRNVRLKNTEKETDHVEAQTSMSEEKACQIRFHLKKPASIPVRWPGNLMNNYYSYANAFSMANATVATASKIPTSDNNGLNTESIITHNHNNDTRTSPEKNVRDADTSCEFCNLYSNNYEPPPPPPTQLPPPLPIRKSNLKTTTTPSKQFLQFSPVISVFNPELGSKDEAATEDVDEMDPDFDTAKLTREDESENKTNNDAGLKGQSIHQKSPIISSLLSVIQLLQTKLEEISSTPETMNHSQHQQPPQNPQELLSKYHSIYVQAEPNKDFRNDTNEPTENARSSTNTNTIGTENKNNVNYNNDDYGNQLKTMPTNMDSKNVNGRQCSTNKENVRACAASNQALKFDAEQLVPWDIVETPTPKQMGCPKEGQSKRNTRTIDGRQFSSIPRLLSPPPEYQNEDIINAYSFSDAKKTCKQTRQNQNQGSLKDKIHNWQDWENPPAPAASVRPPVVLQYCACAGPTDASFSLPLASDEAMHLGKQGRANPADSAHECTKSKTKVKQNPLQDEDHFKTGTGIGNRAKGTLFQDRASTTEANNKTNTKAYDFNPKEKTQVKEGHTRFNENDCNGKHAHALYVNPKVSARRRMNGVNDLPAPAPKMSTHAQQNSLTHALTHTKLSPPELTQVQSEGEVKLENSVEKILKLDPWLVKTEAHAPAPKIRPHKPPLHQSLPLPQNACNNKHGIRNENYSSSNNFNPYRGSFSKPKHTSLNTNKPSDSTEQQPPFLANEYYENGQKTTPGLRALNQHSVGTKESSYTQYRPSEPLPEPLKLVLENNDPIFRFGPMAPPTPCPLQKTKDEFKQHHSMPIVGGAGAKPFRDTTPTASSALTFLYAKGEKTPAQSPTLSNLVRSYLTKSKIPKPAEKLRKKAAPQSHYFDFDPSLRTMQPSGPTWRQSLNSHSVQTEDQSLLYGHYTRDVQCNILDSNSTLERASDRKQGYRPNNNRLGLSRMRISEIPSLVQIQQKQQVNDPHSFQIANGQHYDCKSTATPVLETGQHAHAQCSNSLMMENRLDQELQAQLLKSSAEQETTVDLASNNYSANSTVFQCACAGAESIPHFLICESESGTQLQLEVCPIPEDEYQENGVEQNSQEAMAVVSNNYNDGSTFNQGQRQSQVHSQNLDQGQPIPTMQAMLAQLRGYLDMQSNYEQLQQQQQQQQQQQRSARVQDVIWRTSFVSAQPQNAQGHRQSGQGQSQSQGQRSERTMQDPLQSNPLQPQFNFNFNAEDQDPISRPNPPVRNVRESRRRSLFSVNSSMQNPHSLRRQNAVRSLSQGHEFSCQTMSKSKSKKRKR